MDRMRKWAGPLTVAALAVGVLSACEQSAEDKRELLEYGAQDVCEQFVKDRLKSPATAEFDGWKVTGPRSRMVAAGVVDSENSFGAMLRNRFTCVVTPTDTANENWKLIDITMGEN